MKLRMMAAACLIVVASAHAADGKWTEGYGQGNLEYFIDNQGWRLHIGCPTQDGSADSVSGVSVYRIADNAQAKSFALTVGGISYEGPFEASSRVGDNNFLSLLQGLRKSDVVVKIGAKSLGFPKSNAATVLPVHGKKFRCNLSM